MLPRRLLLVLFLGLLIALSACSSNEEETAVAGRIELTPILRAVICHATGFDIKPYVEITVSEETADRHRSHGWDIIPAPLEGCPEALDVSDAPDAIPTGDAPGEPGEDTERATPTPRPAPAACETGDSVADVLRGDERLSRLAEAFEQSGFMDVLEQHEPLTIFAPTDEAFDSLPEEVVEDWIEDEGRLNALLLYHTVDGDYPSDELRTYSSLETVSGELIRIEVEDDKIVLNGEVRLVEADQEACNGIVHMIDGVLLPAILEEEARPTPTPQPTATQDDDRDEDRDEEPTARPEPTERPTDQPDPATTPEPTVRPTEPPAPTDTPDAGDTGGDDDTGGSSGG